MSGGAGKQPPVSVDIILTKTQVLVSDIEVPGSLQANESTEIRPEVSGTSHWWKNPGKETVILYVGDVRKDPHDHNM